jgi:RimJ/RimL family protein N-acetyltransferase
VTAAQRTVPQGGSERIVANFPSVAEWVADQVKVKSFLGPHHSFAFFRDGELAGACVFDAFTDHECCIHLAIHSTPVPIWAIRSALAYPFQQLKLKRITAAIRADNEPALAIAKRNGFVEEGRKRKAAGDCDEVIMGLLAEECAHVR